MKLIESRIYQLLTKLFNYVILTLLFLFACLPIITIGPAINSIFLVSRDWLNKTDDRVITPFMKHFFNPYFFINTLFSFVFVLITGAYYMNLKNILPLQTQVDLIILIIMVVSMFTVIGITINYYLLITSFKLKLETKEILKRVMEFTTINLGRTLLSGLMLFLFLPIIYLFPIIIFFVITPLVRIIFKIHSIS